MARIEGKCLSGSRSDGQQCHACDRLGFHVTVIPDLLQEYILARSRLTDRYDEDEVFHILAYLKDAHPSDKYLESIRWFRERSEYEQFSIVEDVLTAFERSLAPGTSCAPAEGTMESSPSVPDAMTTLEREMVVRALQHMCRTDKTLSEPEAMMAKRLAILLAPPPSMPDLGAGG
jgi:hypothetical protein